jgi:PAS domain S-box-containing protein
MKTEPENTFPIDSMFFGGGEMGALMRAFDWSQTPVGPISKWPQSLRTATRIILTSRYAMFIWWGRELVNLYNDPYREFLGIKHPTALGTSARDVWAEIWDEIGPRADAVLLRGESTFDEALLLLMERHGYLEETYFTFAYSPLPDDAGGIGGLFCAVTEETQQVVGERRLRLLREIAAATAECRTSMQVCESLARCLSSARRDLPFSLLYLLEPDGQSLNRVAEAGLEGSHPAVPACVTLHEHSTSEGPFRAVMETGEAVLVENLVEHFSDLPKGEWNQAPRHAIFLPIAQQGQKRPAGVFVAGLTPHRGFDDDFKGFLALLSNQIAGAISSAVAFETERKRAEELARLDRAKTQFFSNVSHEFRTPLTLMLGPLEEVLSEAHERLSPERHEQLAAARRNALRLLKLVNTLLDFSRIEAGRVQAVYEPTDLASLTSEVASVFRSAMEKAGLQFSVNCEPLGEPIYVDRDMWEKIVLNLLSNAFKFTFEGEVALALKPVNGSAELSVRDTGIGIPEEERERVFERFHRIESSRAKTYEGTGIGLALVQELARLHSGTVRVQSLHGQGTTFTVSVPRGKAHLPADRIQATRNAASTSLAPEAYVDEAQRWLPRDSGAPDEPTPRTLTSVAADAEALPSEKPLIVVADDNHDMREYIAHLLRGEYRVHAVSDGLQALQASHELRPDLVLADVMMPRLDGFGLLRGIRSDPSLSSIPVILLSARAGEESSIEGLHAGADDYLVKPFTARELVARVATHVKMANLRREATEREVRLRAEAELERHRLQELLAQAPAAIGLLSGPDQCWTYVNEYQIRVTGRSNAADFVGKTFLESLPEMQNQVFPKLLEEAYRSGQPYFGHTMKVILNRVASGQPEEGYFDFVYQPVRDASGQVEGILVHGVEVTDQVIAEQTVEQNEQELRNNQERLRLAQQAAGIGTFEWDMKTNVNRWSPELEAMYGLPVGGFGGTQEAWEALVHPEDRAEAIRQVELSLQTGGPGQGEWRVIWPDGSIHWIFGRWQAFRNESGKFVQLIGINIDLTEQKKAQEARQRFAAIVESSDDAIISKDLNGIVTSWNAGAEKMFGYTEEEMIGRPITTIIPGELYEDENRILATIAHGERIEHFETVRLRKNGKRLEVSLTVSPVKDQAGRIVGAATIARDITETKKAERSLRTAEKLASVGRLAATVAHEINNPLEAITNLIYLAKSSDSQSSARKYLSAAEEELDRIFHISKQTLGFYREPKGATAVRLSTIVTSLLSLFASRTRNKNIQICPEIKGDTEVLAVPEEIRQVVANLLSNSIDAVQVGGRIRIRVSAASEWNENRTKGARLTVADNGAGISPDVRAGLFEPFVTSDKEVGTGLGLWISKSIVEAHGGSIRVRSSAKPGKSWTVFSVFLPARARPVSAKEALKDAV